MEYKLLSGLAMKSRKRALLVAGRKMVYKLSSSGVSGANRFQLLIIWVKYKYIYNYNESISQTKYIKV